MRQLRHVAQYLRGLVEYVLYFVTPLLLTHRSSYKTCVTLPMGCLQNTFSATKWHSSSIWPFSEIRYLWGTYRTRSLQLCDMTRPYDNPHPLRNMCQQVSFCRTCSLQLCDTTQRYDNRPSLKHMSQYLRVRAEHVLCNYATTATDAQYLRGLAEHVLYSAAQVEAGFSCSTGDVKKLSPIAST